MLHCFLGKLRNLENNGYFPLELCTKLCGLQKFGDGTPTRRESAINSDTVGSLCTAPPSGDDVAGGVYTVNEIDGR